ncbi:MAG TPA: hypothetical protein GXX36_15450 [Clostridiaceae bacterium]|nr:hypothetical protein [Clostridiaceae bacterium]
MELLDQLITEYNIKDTDDIKNMKKTVRSEYGKIELDIPRDRNGEFEPQIVKKNQTEIKGIEGQIDNEPLSAC